MINLIDGLISILESWGYSGIFVLMFLESLIIPVPAEIVLIPAGFLVFKGLMSFFPLLIISTLGSLAGSLFSYFLAYKIGRKGFEKIAKKYSEVPFWDIKHLKNSEKFFKKKGHLTIFFSRFIPGLRHVISLPAGFSKMNIIEFSLYTLFGAGIYNAFLILLGYFAGTNENYFISHVGIISALIAIIFLVGIGVYLKLKNKK
ncbi:DedA family protein [archaeon]|nr:DedA family protein [archaeon]